MKPKIFFLFILFFAKTNAEEITADSVCAPFDVPVSKNEQVFLELKADENFSSPNIFLQHIREKVATNKKLISAALAFPIPFGFVGAHRIYFGSKPYIPLVYISTVGGCFGILPFIDFVVILFTKPESLGKFENNNRVFMWAN